MADEIPPKVPTPPVPPVLDDDDDHVEVGENKVRKVTDYEKKLRDENKKYRLRASDAEKRLADTETNHKTALEAVQKAAKEDSDKRVVMAEFKAIAIKAGIVDVDGLKLLDTSTLKFNDKGELVGADELIEAAKKSKPYLFATTTSTTSTSKTPPKVGDEPKSVKTMTDAEYEAAKQSAIKVRR